MSELKQLIKFEREDFCPKCKKERALILYNSSGIAIDYPLLLDEKRKDQFDPSNGKTYSHLKCRFCGNEYFIDWNTSEYPKPMCKNFYKRFLHNFKMTKVV